MKSIVCRDCSRYCADSLTGAVRKAGGRAVFCCSGRPRSICSGSHPKRSPGAEVDLVLQLPGARVFAIEIKRSLAPVRSKGFEIGSDDVGATHRYVVYPGTDTFDLDRRTTAIPLSALVAAMAKKD